MKVNSIKYQHHIPLGNIHHPEVIYQKPSTRRQQEHQHEIILTDLEYAILQDLSTYPYTIKELYIKLHIKKAVVSNTVLKLQTRHFIFFKWEIQQGRWYLTHLGKRIILGEIINGQN